MKDNNRIMRSMRALLALIVLVVAVDIVMSYLYFVKDHAYAVYVVDAATLLIVIFLAVLISKSVIVRFRERVVEVATQFGGEYQQYMNQWEYPYAMMNANMRLIWCNEAFRKVLETGDVNGKKLEDLEIEWGTGKPDWDPIIRRIKLKDSVYEAEMTQIRVREEREDPTDESGLIKIYSLSLRDISKELKLEQENLDQQSVIGLFYLDNYDQILGAIDENQRPVLEAAVFRKLSDMSTELGGIMTQLERDRFFVVFPHKNLQRLYDNKFRILEDIKSLENGSRYQSTLSVGIGVDKDIEVARKFARSGVDLAMGRGGDQAVVRSKDDQKFFGGMSTTVENSTRVRARLIAYALKERIEASDNVILMGHANPDLDCFGAALGMYRAVFEMKKPVYIAMSNQHHPAVDYLYRRVSEEAEYKDALIDEDRALKIARNDKKTLLIVVDVNRKAIVQFPDLINVVDEIVVIDHHRTAADSIEGVVFSYVEPFASSCSEMVTELLQYMLENPPLTPIEADGLFAGIALDTKNFTVKTGVRTFEAAAYLRRRGADSIRVRKMFKNDMGDYKAKAKIVSSAEIFGDKIAIASWESRLPNASTVAAQASDELLDIHGITASFVLTQIDEGQVNISARSLGEVNVQLVMEELGGGGHLSMAGAQLKDVTLETAKGRLIEAIEKVLPEMRSPSWAENNPKGEKENEDLIE